MRLFGLELLKGSTAKLVNREDLNDDQIFQRYYSTSGKTKEGVIETWHEIAEILRVPTGKMRPQDNLANDLSHEKIITPKMDNLSEAAIERMEKNGLTLDLLKVITVDDYVNGLAL